MNATKTESRVAVVLDNARTLAAHSQEGAKVEDRGSRTYRCVDITTIANGDYFQVLHITLADGKLARASEFYWQSFTDRESSRRVSLAKIEREVAFALSEISCRECDAPYFDLECDCCSTCGSAPGTCDCADLGPTL